MKKIKWKFWEKDDGLFPSAEQSTLSTIKAKQLNEENEIKKLKELLKRDISNKCDIGFDRLTFWPNGSDEMSYLYAKYETKMKAFLIENGYSVTIDGGGLINIKWDDKQTLFNNQMKDILSNK